MNALILLIFIVACAVGFALVLNQVSTWLYTVMSAGARLIRRWTIR